MVRRIAIEPLESRRLLSVTGSLSGFAYLDTHNFGTKDANEAGFAGLTVRLQGVDNQGGLSNVSGVGPVQTLTDGSYSFNGLAAGTYQIQISPSSKLAVGGPSAGSAGGTVGSNEIQVTLAADQSATDYNFAILGAQTNQISLRLFMASNDTLTHFLTNLHTPPSAPYTSPAAVGSSDSSSFTATYTTGGPGVAIVSSSATLTAIDSPTLTSMTVTLQNPQDGSGEQLSANTTGTMLTSSYANGVLTVSGVADIADYQTVLRTVTYRITSSPAHAGDRTLSIVINDGTATSTAATSTISVVQGTETAPTVTSNPATQTVNAGNTATFTATSSGAPAPTVQWEMSTDGGTTFNPISGATSTTYSFTVTADLNGNQYEAIFTNSTGSATTAPATLTVDHVTTSPTSQTINAGQNASFTAASSNPGGADTVQWKVNTGSGFIPLSNDAVYSGVTTTTLTITGATAGLNGNQYEAVFTNSVGTFASNPATLTVDYAPTVTTNPASHTTNVGNTTTFTAAASGNPSFTVQWELNTGSGFSPLSNDTVYSGVTTTTLTITGATAGLNGDQYEAIFTNSVGSATTTAATLTVDHVTTAPTSQTINVGQNATFTAASSNPGGADTVQWKVNTGSGFIPLSNDAIYSGVTTTILSITGATAGLNGNLYEAVFSNSVGTFASSPATLTVHYAPIVATNPATHSVNAGSATTFTAAANGDPAPTVQWEVNTGSGFTLLSNDAVYSGATTTTLTITGATAGLNGNQYEAVFTNSFGTATTMPATLTVDHVTTAPTPQTINAGQNASFTATSSNPGGLDTVQWKVNTGSGFTPLSNDAVYGGVTTTTLTITGAAAGLNGNQYEAVFTNSFGTFASSPATLTVDHVATAPTPQTINAGQNASFTAISSNPGGLDTVQWKVNTGSGFIPLSNDAVYSGVATTTLTITGATAGLNGNQYEAIFTNSRGTFASSPVALTVHYAPTVTTNPATQSINAGNTATFTAAAGGNPASAVQWEVNTGSGFVPLSNDTVYSGTTTTTLTITGATAGLSGNQYEAVFTNSVGSATTTPATLTVDHVTTAPAPQTIDAGQNATFTAASSNPGGADTVQWRVNTGSGFIPLSNDAVYSGVTTTTLTITGATAGLNGNQYEAVFTNSLGTFASSPATLTVHYAPTVTTNPVTQTTNAGNTATFTAAANGSPAPVVQWEVNTGSGFTPLSNDAVYSGVTTTTLTITGVTAGLNGNQYKAVFTNSVGSATTTAATLAVDHVTTAPIPQTIDAGQNATFTATSSNPGGADTVQWRVNTGSGFIPLSNDAVYSGVTTTTLTITGATAGLNGNQYEAVFTNSFGTFASSPATLTVDYTPTVTTNPATQSINAGDTATFTAAASGNPATSVQWKVNTGSGFNPLPNDTVYSGVTSPTLTITGATIGLNGNQYEAVFTNSLGSATTTPASLNVWAWSVTADKAAVNGTTGKTTGITLTGGTIGDTYHYSISSSGGGAPITSSGPVTAVTQDITGIDVTSLQDGTLTYSVTLTHAGNTSPARTATSVLDRVAPSGYTATVDQSTYNIAASKSAGFTITNAEVGTTLRYLIVGHLSGYVIKYVPITSSTQDITGIDISSLSSGQATFTITLTDAAGNTGIQKLVYATLDKSVPSGYTISANLATINASTAATTGFTFVNADTTAGTTFNYTVTSSGVPGSGQVSQVTGSGPVTSATQNITPIDVSKLPDGTLTYSVTLTNAIGNIGAATTATAVLNKDLPSGYSIMAQDAVITTDTLHATSFTFSGAQVGATYHYTISSTGGGTPVTNSGAVASASQSVTGIDLSGLLDGALTYSVTLTDIHGNTGVAATAGATLDRNAPLGYSITANQPAVNKAGASTASFTLHDAAVNSTYQYTVTSSGGGVAVTGSGTVASIAQIIPDVNVGLLGDGTLTYRVTVTQNGHTGATAEATATLDQTAPSGFTVTPDQSTINAVAVSSTGFTLRNAEVGTTYTYQISSVSGSPVIDGGGPVIGGGPITGGGSVTSATQDIGGINLSPLADGAITISVTLTDAAGNVSTPIIVPATIDRTAPTAIALSTSVAPANQTGGLVGLLQTVGPQSSASYTYSLVPGSGSADNASFQPIPVGSNELRTAVSLNPAGQSSYSIRVRSTDSQGKFIEQQFLITVSDTDPVTPAVLIDGSSSGASIAASQSTAGALVGTLATAAASGGLVASQINYSLVSGTGSTNNSSFQIVNGDIQTTDALTAGSYSIRVRSSGTFLISDVVNLGGISGPYAYQVSFDPAQLPSSNYQLLAADAGLISLSSDPSAGSWNPAVSQNKQVAGSLAEPNYLGSYSSFWASVKAANPSAALSDVVGSSGVDLAAHTVWAVVDRSGEYAVGVEVFTEKVFTITVTNA